MAVKTVLHNPWVQALALLGALVLLIFLAYSLSFVLVPLFLAFIVAYFLDPVVDYFEKRKVSRGVTVSVLAIIGVLLFLSIPLFIVPSIIHQADALVQASMQPPKTEDDEFIGWQGRLQEYGYSLLDSLPLNTFVEVMNWGDPKEENFNAKAVVTQNIAEWVRENARNVLTENFDHIRTAGAGAGVSVAGVFRAMGRFVVSTFVFLANFALFGFVAGYLLKDFDGIKDSALELVPPKYRSKLVSIMADIDRQLQSFLRGQMTVCLFLGTMYAIGLLIAGTPFGILIALFGMVASFVPYLGILLTVIPAVILTLLRFGIDWHIVVVLTTFVLAQTIEGNVLTPRIVGSQVGLSPVWVILAVLVFGNLLGFLGLLLAVPIAACLKVLVVEALQIYRASRVFKDSSSPSPDSST